MNLSRPPDPPRVRTSPPHGKVLVVAPHPDDECFGAGGTLRLHHLQGDPVTGLFICSGIAGDPEGYLEREALVPLRQQEARAAAACLGIGELLFWGYPDNLSEADFGAVFENLPEEPEAQREALVKGLAEKLGQLLDEGAFNVIYHPWELEINPDHWAVGQAMLRLRESRPELDQRLSCLGYEVWSSLVPETVMDISDVIGAKVSALHCYKSQLLYQDLEPAMLGLAASRRLFLETGATFGEAFRGHYREDRDQQQENLPCA